MGREDSRVFDCRLVKVPSAFHVCHFRPYDPLKRETSRFYALRLEEHRKALHLSIFLVVDNKWK